MVEMGGSAKKRDTTKVHFNARAATPHLPVSERSPLQKCKIAFAFAFHSDIGTWDGRGQMLTHNL